MISPQPPPVLLKNKYLQYGDLIYLYSNEEPKTYLSARSFLEKSVFFLQTPDFELLNIFTYGLQSELVFSIYPKLYYEASKNYMKFKGSDLRKKSMLKKRMEAEKEINQKRIERFLNDFVTIGSEIQLFHVFSKCYVKATREKNSKSNQLFNLSLAKQLSSGMHFKIRINPYYSFKKDGEKISYEDQFYFENVKLESRLVYKDIPMNPSLLGKGNAFENNATNILANAPNNKSPFGKQLKRQQNVVSEDLKIENLFLMENQSVFKHFEAGHRKDDINNFKALYLSSPEHKDPPASNLKAIRYGDYIRIKHIRRLDKKQGNLYSEHIVTGECPKTFLYTQEPNIHNNEEKESAASIFQIISINEELNGKRLEIATEKFAFPIFLRHLLTGRYLRIADKSRLSEPLERIIEKNPRLFGLISRKPVFKQRKTTVFNTYKDLGSPIKDNLSLFRNTHKPSSIIHTLNNEKGQESGNNNDEKNQDKQLLDQIRTNENPFNDDNNQEILDYFNDVEILLTVASKDLGFLNSSHCFSLMGKESEMFMVIAEDETVNEGKYTQLTEENQAFNENSKSFLSSECFQRTFFNMNPLERKNFAIKTSNEADFFFFCLVPLEEISEIMTIQSRMTPLIALSSNLDYFNRNEIVVAGENSLEKLCLWVCESKEKRVEQIKSKPIKTRQKLLRELGLIDIIMKILFEMYDRRMMIGNVMKSGTEIFSLANSLINLLLLANNNNYPNSIYIFQWYSLIKMIITDETTVRELKFDDLLIQLFHETKLNVSYRGDLERLVQNIDFNNFNRNVLNLVIAFCTFNEFLQKDDIEEIIATLLEIDKNRMEIFRAFALKHQQQDQNRRIVLKMEKNLELEVNERNFATKQKIFQYVSKLIVLAIELSKGNPALVMQYYEELYPFEVCLEVLKAKRINCGFKSLFINLFIESYLTWDCRYSNIVTFPNNIKVKGRGVSHNLIDSKIKQNNMNLMIKYFNELGENKAEPSESLVNITVSNLNLKIIIKDYLHNPEFFSKSPSQVNLEDHHLIKSMMMLINFVLFRGFYTSITEAEDLRVSLQSFLKNSYAFLSILTEKKLNHNSLEKQNTLLDISEEISHKRTAKINEDIIAVSHWMTKVIESLIFLEKKNQDSFVSDFIAESKNLRFFEDTPYSSVVKNKEKRAKIKEFMYTLQYPDAMDIYYFIELLLLNNIDVSQCVVELLYLIFSMRRNFLINMNQLLLIEDSEFPLYQSIISVYYKLHFSIVEVNYSKSTDNQRNNELLCELDSGLKALNGVLFLKSTELPNENKNPNIRNHNNHNNKNSLDSLSESNYIYKINDETIFDIRDCFRKQNLLREIGLHSQILEIIRFVNKNSTYKDKVMELKNEILKKCLVFLIFFNLRNEENRGEIRDYEKFEDLLIEILLRDSKNLQKLVFKLISEIYRDNYPVLLNLDKMNNEMAGKLGKKFTLNYEVKKNKEFCIYFLLLLTTFFKIKSKVLTQNQVFIIKEFNKSIPDFVRTIDKCLKIVQDVPLVRVQSIDASPCLKDTKNKDNSILKKKDRDSSKSNLQKQETKDSLSKEKKESSPLLTSIDPVKESSEIVIEIPEDVVLLTVFFNVFSQIAEKSNNYVLSYCKQFLGIRELHDLLLRLDNWFMLKLEILSFLNQIYIKNKKLEENESSELQFFIKEGLLKELDDFLENYKQVKDDKRIFHSPIVNIFESKTNMPFSDETNLIHTDYFSCYEHYVISGIVETFSNYLDKIPKKPNEIDIMILEIYGPRLDSLCKVLNIDTNSKNQKSSIVVEKNKDFNKSFLVNKGKKMLIQVNEDKSPESPQKSHKKTVNFGNLDYFSNEKPPNELNIFNNNNNQEVKKSLLVNVELNENQKDDLKFEAIENLSNIDLITASTIARKKNPQMLKDELRLITGEIIGYSKEDFKENLHFKNNILLEEELERTHFCNEHPFEESLIEEEHSMELDYLVEFFIEIKTHENRDVNKFKKIVESLINVVGSHQSSIKTKLNAIKIIRKLSNYKKDMRVNEEIQKELVDIELMNFLCKVTAEEENPLIKYEYILGLVDFMDEVNENIQKSFYKYIENDQENKFIIKMKEYIQENFSDFKDYEKSLSENQSELQIFGVSSKFNKIIHQKSSACIAGLELLRLGCENHYTEMQNFLRCQVQNGKVHQKSVNMIAFAADLLEKYSKMITERNKDLGEKILDFLIETLQGPCNENQLVLCNSTKILENLEDIMLDLQVQKTSSKIAGFTNKMIILMLALFEGNSDGFILNKIVTYVTPELMYDRIGQIYRNFYKLSKKNAYKEIRSAAIVGSNTARKEPTIKSLIKKTTNRNSTELQREESIELGHFKTDRGVSDERVENSISEGFNIYILMKLLSSVYPKLKAKISNWKKQKLIREASSEKELENFKKSIKFYRTNVVMIEIINDQKDIQRVFFRLPLCTRFLSSISAKDFLATVNRESIDEKINGLLNNSAKFLEEMRHFMYLRAKGFRLGIGSLSIVRDVGLIVSTIISIIILWKPDQNPDENYKNLLFFFSYMQLCIEVIVFCLWGVYTLPLDLKTALRNYHKLNEVPDKAVKNTTDMTTHFFNPLIAYFSVLRYMLFSSYFIYFTMNICWATLGITVSPIFNCMLLLDIIDRSVILQNVVKSITINWPQLVMTGILGVIVMFIYSMIGFYSSDSFRDNMIYTNQIGWDNNETLYLCDSPIHCFMFVVNIGLRSGGGVGDSVTQPMPSEDEGLYNERFFYDLSFFLIMNVILLNIIFGIIIDTFAELRVQKNMRDFDEKNNCFICGTERSTFEKVGISFNKHIKKEHNLWNYLFYVIHLNLKDPKDYNGTESYVAAKLKMNDISWFPIGRALSLSLSSDSHFEKGQLEKEGKKNE